MSIANVPYAQAAESIRDAGIDVLIECSGHSDLNRLDVCAARPAPVQMTFLGYPNTTGLKSIDYRLVDEITDPPGSETYCEETLLRVPGCLWCFRPVDDAPPVAPAPAEQVGKATIGCFNNLAKITPEAIAAWAEILRRLPGATMLFKNKRLYDPPTMGFSCFSS